MFTDFIKNYPEIINNPINYEEKINNLNNNINELEQDKKDLEMILNDKENEINHLKSNEDKYINEINNYQNEIEKLKKEKQENNKNIISNNDNKDKMILSLMEQIKAKDDIINELRKNNAKNQIDLKEDENLIPVIFQSIDSKIHYAFICKKTDKFHKIEDMLYEKYPEYLEIENYFTVNGNKINKSKTIGENKIKYSDIILLNTYDDI